MRYLKIVLAALAVSAWAAGPLSAAAGAALLAPEYQSSSPEKDAMMDEPPAEVTVTFSEPLDQSSVMNVLDECGKEIDSGPATVQLNEMTVGIGKTPSGMYKVVYRAVGLAGATGESNSTFEFMVHNGKPCKGSHGKHDDHKGKKKKDHRNHDPRKDEHDDHDDDDGSRDDHDDHSSTGGSSHSSGNHDSGSMDDHSAHEPGSMGGGHDKHRGHDPKKPGGTGPTTENPPLADGPGGTALQADAEAMLIGLGLALAVGVLGGWLLRTSGKLVDAA